MAMRLIDFITSIVLFYVSVHFTLASVSVVLNRCVDQR